MWFEPDKYKKEVPDFNEEIKKLTGELTDKEARITLAKFLYRNLGITTHLLTGIDLYPDQIVTIKGMLESNYTLCVWGRGVSKTWTAAVYCILQMIFAPKTNILIAGPTFRTARFIFDHIEKIVSQPEAQMLAQAFDVRLKVRRNDEFRWPCNGGEVRAIPLNGEKIRGFRANILLIDEFLLMPEELVERVLIPYLVVPKDLARRKRIRAKEDELVKKGVITDAQRTKFTNDAKMIALSSASFTCEYLYRKYEQYIKEIYDPKMPENGAKYFVSQLSWDSVPEDRIDKSVVEMASSQESNLATFKREYCAQFTDGSDSYFSMKKMIECTVKDGEEPTLKVKGQKDRKYILSIDPNASNSPTSDDFGMCVLELDDDLNGGTIVNQYAESGRDLKDHILYLFYVLTNFNIEMICIDHAGYQFIEAANESEAFRNAGINLKIFEFSAEKDGDELQEELKNAKRNYNKSIGRIVFTQYFTSDFLRKGNEWLQGCFDYKRIWFGGSIKALSSSFDKAISTNIDVQKILPKADLSDESPMMYFIDKQETLIKQVKYQCAAIEVKTSGRGIQSFDLPLIMKRNNTMTRMRKDSYTCCMLASWGAKCYKDIQNLQAQSFETFEPIMV